VQFCEQLPFEQVWLPEQFVFSCGTVFEEQLEVEVPALLQVHVV